MLISQAAANNAAWCDLVSRSHGLNTSVDELAWTSLARTPPYYPDAVTLSPGISAPELLARIDASHGCSVKDSFASLDLSSFGFEILFDAQWIVRPPASRPPTETTWEVVDTEPAFVIWERAWRGDDGQTDVLRADLLDNDDVTVLASRRGGHVIAGAILNRGAEVVGISNVFSTPADDADTWSACLGLGDELFPRSTFVGYESGTALTATRAAGFKIAGTLRIWISR